MKKYIAKSILIAAAIVAYAGAARAEIFTAYLNGAQEVPANSSTAQGYARVNVNPATGALTFTVVFNNLCGTNRCSHSYRRAGRQRAGIC